MPASFSDSSDSQKQLKRERPRRGEEERGPGRPRLQILVCSLLKHPWRQPWRDQLAESTPPDRRAGTSLQQALGEDIHVTVGERGPEKRTRELCSVTAH